MQFCVGNELSPPSVGENRSAATSVWVLLPEGSSGFGGVGAIGLPKSEISSDSWVLSRLLAHIGPVCFDLFVFGMSAKPVATSKPGGRRMPG